MTGGRDGIVEETPIYILYLSQTYLRLWIQFLSSPLCWVTT